MLLKLAYAIATLIVLWTGAGADAAAMWSRAPIGSILLAVLALVVLKLEKKPELLKRDRRAAMIGMSTGALCGLAALLVIYFGRHMGDALPWWWTNGVNALAPLADARTNAALSALVAALVGAPAVAILSRGLLQPSWGLGGVAFLDAIAFGFATQNFVVFLFVWGVAFLTGRLALRFGTVAAAVATAVFSLIALEAAVYL